MRIDPVTIDGCYAIQPRVIADARGSFIKTFHREVFEEYGLVTDFAEEYYSVSKKGVLRGMHFQTPPKDHFKLVYCLSGKVLDAIVDLRKGSPTYGVHAMFDLSAEQANMLYIAPGIAHGFYALSDDVIMQYKVTTVYSREHDSGIRWDSAGIAWPNDRPVISERDAGFVKLSEFDSPFQYEG